MTLHRRFLVLVAIPVALVLIGTLGYWLIEPGYSLFDALYMTVITITTVGYGEIPHQLSTAGRAFTIFLLLGGVFSLFYTMTELIRVVVTGEVQQLLGRQLMERNLAALKGHLIVCGYGRMGRYVCREFSRQGQPFVILDRHAELLADFSMPHGIALTGDATSDEVLKRAGADRARALVAVLPSDADNLYIVMSARLLNGKLLIVSRAESPEAEQKLRRAGADRVVAPYALGGNKVAQAVTRPTVLEFIELATETEHLDLQLEQVRIEAGSGLSGTTLASSRLRTDLGLIIVAIKKKHGAMLYTPPPEAVIESGDTLLALGKRSQLEQLERQASGEGR